jgi:hypothetical protein
MSSGNIMGNKNGYDFTNEYHDALKYAIYAQYGESPVYKATKHIYDFAMGEIEKGIINRFEISKLKPNQTQKEEDMPFFLGNKQKQKEENMVTPIRNSRLDEDDNDTFYGSTGTQAVRIIKVNNGFIITIGCATFVETDWKKVCNALKEYWDDPVKAEKKYYKK